MKPLPSLLKPVSVPSFSTTTVLTAPIFRARSSTRSSNGKIACLWGVAVTLQLAQSQRVKVSWQPLSLENPVGEEDDSELASFVEDDTTPTPTQTVYQNLLREKLDYVLSTLSPREARILRLRFGLSNGRSYTLEEVGRKFGLTRERIRQIEGKALHRLRHPRRQPAVERLPGLMDTVWTSG